jgi:hypothetical protein
MPSVFKQNSAARRAVALALISALFFSACTAAAQPPPRPALPKLESFDPAQVAAIEVSALPVIPDIDAGTQSVIQDAFSRGTQQGNRPGVFTKFGDCMTENPAFLAPLADGDVQLGDHGALKPVLDRFRAAPARMGEWTDNAFGTRSLGAAGGFNIAAPLDPTWSDPSWCKNSESPLACELRVAKPAYAVIMFGTNDVSVTDGATYNYYLRVIVNSALEAGVVPILSTFPERPEDPAKTRLLNQIAIQVSKDYRVPIMNLYRALEALPDRGVDLSDTIHLNAPPDGRTDVFDAEHLRYGFTMRNLVVLQALDAVITASEGRRGS